MDIEPEITALAVNHNGNAINGAATKSGEGVSSHNQVSKVPFGVGKDFPVDAFPAWVADQCTRLAIHRNVDPAIPAIGFLGACSVAIGQGMNFQHTTGDRPIPANLWLAIVGEPSCGKSVMLEPFGGLEDLLKEHSEEAKKSFTELEAERKVLEAQLRKAEKSQKWSELKQLQLEIAANDEKRAAVRPLWMTNDFTPEAISQGFCCKGRPRVISVVASEGRTVMKNLGGRYSKTGCEDFFLTGWNRYTDSRHRTRKNHCHTLEDGFIQGMHLSLCVGLQTDEGQKLSSSPLSTSGFAQRLLYAPVSSAKKLICPAEMPERAQTLSVPSPDLSRWNDFTRQVFKTSALNSNAALVLTTKKANREWIEFYALLNALRQKDSSAAIKSQIDRWGECAARVSLALHVMEHGTNAPNVEISQATMRGACRIVHWFGLKIYQHRTSSPLAETKLERSICSFALKKGDEGFALYELTRTGLANRKELETVISGLVPHKLVPCGKTGDKRAGRPNAKRWRYNSASQTATASLS